MLHAAGTKYCLIPEFPETLSTTIPTDTLYILLDSDDSTCIDPFGDGRTTFQISMGTLLLNETTSVQIVGLEIPCEDLATLYFENGNESCSRGSGSQSTKYQCRLDDIASEVLTVCYFRCFPSIIFEGEVTITLLLELTKWSPDTHRNAKLCDIQFVEN